MPHVRAVYTSADRFQRQFGARHHGQKDPIERLFRGRPVVTLAATCPLGVGQTVSFGGLGFPFQWRDQFLGEVNLRRYIRPM